MHKMKFIYFSYFLTFFSNFGNKIVILLDLSSYTAIINAIQTAVINQFIALKNRKMNFNANQNKIVFSCRILHFSII